MEFIIDQMSDDMCGTNASSAVQTRCLSSSCASSLYILSTEAHHVYWQTREVTRRPSDSTRASGVIYTLHDAMWGRVLGIPLSNIAFTCWILRLSSRLFPLPTFLDYCLYWLCMETESHKSCWVNGRKRISISLRARRVKLLVTVRKVEYRTF